MNALRARMDAALPAMLADIAQLVRCESPSADLDAVARSADLVAEVGARHLGVGPERIVLDGVSHLRWRLGPGPRRVLLLGHHDTVWPVGSLATHPVTTTGGVLRGPGCFDMKAGLVMALCAASELADPDGVTLLITGDEELGSPTSRALIEAEAQGCAAVLVLEAAADGGAVKTERKGVSLYRVEVSGRAAHAGLEPEKGVNAAVELAHQLLAVSELGDHERGTTVTATVTSAGTATNTVPAHGTFAVDVRARHAREQARVDEAIRGLAPVLPGARLQVHGGPNRAPLELASSRDLYARAADLAGDLGLPQLGCAAVGGASDGNLTASMGVPTLDGLGGTGGGAHADDEHVLIADLPGRAALVAALLADVLARPDPSGGADPGSAVGGARRRPPGRSPR